MKIINQKIICFGAHPDDIEYFGGGTLLKLAKDNKIIFIIATDGGFNGQKRIRRQEQKNAAEKIGVKKVIFLHYDDLGLEQDKKSLQKEIIKLILKIRPNIVFSFDTEKQMQVHSFFHPDHRTLAFIVAESVTLYCNLKTYLNYIGINNEPLKRKPELWLFDSAKNNHFENIDLENKKEVIKIFKSQNLFLDNLKPKEGFKRISFCSKIKEDEII